MAAQREKIEQTPNASKFYNGAMQDNPYRPPESLEDRITQEAENCWRDGVDLVVNEESKLPDVCIYCCGRFTKRVRRRFVVYPRSNRLLQVLLIILGVGLSIAVVAYGSIPLMVVAVSIVVSFLSAFYHGSRSKDHPKLTTGIPICERHRALSWLPVIALAIIVVPALLSVAGLEVPKLPSYAFFFAVIACAFMPSRLSAMSYSSGRFWIRGCNEKFLNMLPSWRQSQQGQPDAPREC